MNLDRILLVEDNLNDVELTLAALSEHQLADRIDVVRDGVEALEFLRRQGSFADRPAGNPLMILLDLKLPKLDGVQVLKEIKGDAALKMIPVIMLTSSREERDLVASYQSGVNAYVVKPVDFGQFVEAVRQIGTFWAATNERYPET